MFKMTDREVGFICDQKDVLVGSDLINGALPAQNGPTEIVSPNRDFLTSEPRRLNDCPSSPATPPAQCILPHAILRILDVISPQNQPGARCFRRRDAPGSSNFLQIPRALARPGRWVRIELLQTVDDRPVMMQGPDRVETRNGEPRPAGAAYG
jgi:hypothetical protein